MVWVKIAVLPSLFWQFSLDLVLVFNFVNFIYIIFILFSIFTLYLFYNYDILYFDNYGTYPTTHSTWSYRFGM